jgi:hypothetical protein
MTQAMLESADGAVQINAVHGDEGNGVQRDWMVKCRLKDICGLHHPGLLS